MSTRIRKAFNDPSRFEGNGISYKAKLIGIEDVKEARGDLMCQEALIKLKNSVKITGEHKRKIFVNVTLEGLKIIDAISLASNQNKKKSESKSPKLGEGIEQTELGQDLIVLHIHPVHRISFISRDTTDNRAFGYVFGTEDGLHKFFAIKTAAAAENLVLTLKDLFQVVYDMKKREMAAAKEKLEKVEITANVQKENLEASRTGSTSGIGQTPAQKASADTENIYQVPTNNAPVNPETRAEQVANLLDLEDQADHILKGIEQIKNLDFDSVTSNSFSPPTSPPTSPMANLASLSPAVNTSDDLWGFSANTPQYSSAPATSALGDLVGLQTGAYPAMSQHPFTSTSFPAQSGFGASAGFNMSGGLPLTKDPFASDPFGSPVQQPRIPVASGFGMAPGFSQPYGMQAMQQRMGMMGVHGMMPGMIPRGMMSPPVMGVVRSPFGVQQSPGFQMPNMFAEDPNILQPMKKDSGLDSNAGNPEPVKPATKTRGDLFGDLLEIKKSSPSTAKSPKDMFAQMNSPERKPMNEMTGLAKSFKTSPVAASQNKQAQASDSTSDPFGDLDSVILDKTRGLLLSDSGEEDPFDTSYIPPSLTEPSNHIIHLVKSTIASTNPPPVPLRQPSSNNNNNTDTLSSSPMPSSPPPPPPTFFSEPIPPLPCRTVVKQEIMKDINENVSESLSDTQFTNALFMLPSPAEFPPLFPSYLTNQSSSDVPPSSSTPQPHTQFTQPLPNCDHKGHEGNSEESKAILESSDLSDISSHTQNLNTILTNNCLKSQISEHMDVKNGDITADTDSQASCSDFDAFTYLHSEINSCQVDQSNTDKSDWVGFENCDSVSESPSDFFLPALNTNGEDDPFIMPLHLTSGFKVVAKFGSDPFDDSLGGPHSNDPWDPFASPEHEFNQVNHDSPVNSPFGDAFISPTQQVTSKSFFD